jgi:hypothetical protein
MGTVAAKAPVGGRGDEGATDRSGVDGRVSKSARQDADAAPPRVEAASEALAARLHGSRATLKQSLTLLERSALTLQRCDLVLQRSALLHFLARGSAERALPPPPRPPEKNRGGTGEGMESEPAESA